MKKFNSSFLAVVIALVAVFAVWAVSIATAEKLKGARLVTSSDLDHAFVQSATVKYQLTDEEIAQPVYYSNGTVVRRMNAVIILDYTAIDGRRDERGRRLWRLRIDRPDFLGGPFEKDAPADSGRDPGTFDTLKDGDLVH